jgi:hypothetical protein
LNVMNIQFCSICPADLHTNRFEFPHLFPPSHAHAYHLRAKQMQQDVVTFRSYLRAKHFQAWTALYLARQQAKNRTFDLYTYCFKAWGAVTRRRVNARKNFERFKIRKSRKTMRHWWKRYEEQTKARTHEHMLRRYRLRR